MNMIKVVSFSNNSPINQVKAPQFTGYYSSVANDTFSSTRISDINITVPGRVFDKFLPKSKRCSQEKIDLITNSAHKINNYLIEKGYSPCNDYLISNNLVNHTFKNDAGGRYLNKLEKIALSPTVITNQEESDFLVLHEQAHYLHHQKLKGLGLKFESKPLEKDEKEIIFNNYKKIFASDFNEGVENVIKNVYLQDNLEFVGYYFTFKNRGVKFDEEVDKIYQKYMGP